MCALRMEGRDFLLPGAANTGFSMRKHKRYVLDLPVVVRPAEGKADNRIFLLRTTDISAGGVLFHAEAGLSAGTEVLMTFFLNYNYQEKKIDTRYSYAFRGKVVRTGPGQFAVAFLKGTSAYGSATMSETKNEAPDVPRGVSKRPDGERGR